MSIESIALWHKRARPEPTPRDFDVQLGCHMEEFLEMLETFTLTITESMDNDLDAIIQDAVSSAAYSVATLAGALKRGMVETTITDRKEFLDALADQIVTAVGTAHCTGMNIEQACKVVNRSNWSKFTVDGEPVRDANGKITKGPGYEPPNLEGLY